MGTGTLPNLDVTPTAFDAAHSELLVAQKYDRDDRGNLRTPYPDSAATSRVIASWMNRVDDTLRAIQRRLRGSVPIGTYADQETAAGALMTWSGAASRALLRTAGNAAYASLQVLQLHLGNGARIVDRASAFEGAETAGRGSLGLRTDDGTAWIKTTPSGNTGWQRVGAGSIAQRSVVPVDADNTTAETTLASFELPANTLDVDGRIAALLIRGDVFNNGASRNATIRVYWGDELQWADVVALANVDDRRPLRIDLELIRTGSGTQVLHGEIEISAANSAEPDTGTGGSMAANGLQYNLFDIDAAISEEDAQTFRVTIQHDTATTNMRTRVQAAWLRVE